ncbi:MAG: flagellar protein export ATPase FliI [Hyphomicrobiaceae bacterium]|nr:flagellar protein export ATPase FliI [Hyphomicrobiaceae bacterium]
MKELDRLKTVVRAVDDLPETEIFGRVTGVQGLLVEVAGPLHAFAVGARLFVETGARSGVMIEVVGFRGDVALCLPFDTVEGVRMGCRAILKDTAPSVRPSAQWLGRVIDALGRPVDGKGPLLDGADAFHIKASPPPPASRARLGPPIDLGVRALNTFVTCCEGQRMGIFAGSGVGKSVLLSMLARNTAADVAVIGLIGERGRELQEFIEDDLGPEGLKRAVIVVATSDESALMRKQAAYLAMTTAEAFRAQGKSVLLMMDSLTRFAMAQREIGLAAGEPPTSRGYPPTTFTELPRLLERAGPGPRGEGTITGLFTVLIEGDDHNEPIADAVRSIVDGHIVMERSIAERGRYPAINILKSVSRTMPGSVPEARRPLIRNARNLMSVYADMEELIRLGAYRRGSDADVDRAIGLHDDFETFLSQDKKDRTSLEEGYDRLAAILDGQEG